MATVVLLPGMDGSGESLSEFIAALAPNVESVVVSYPPERALGYSELEALARAMLPTRPFILVGESFSGPVAIALAASAPAGLRGLVLVCSFVRSPVAVPSILRWLVSWFPVWIIPVRIAAALLLGRSSSPSLRQRLSSAIATVKPSVWHARLLAVLSVDISARLREIQVPVLYLRALNDRVVRRAASELVAKYLPGVRIVDIEAPHFMLQARPAESAAQVKAFTRELGLAL